MSDKVSALSAILGIDVDGSDLLYLVDVSAGTSGSRQITVDEFINALDALWDTALVADSTALTDATPVVISQINTTTYTGFKLLAVLTDGTDKEIWTLDGVILGASVIFTQSGGAGDNDRGHGFSATIVGANAEISCTANGSGWAAKTVLIKVPN